MPSARSTLERWRRWVADVIFISCFYKWLRDSKSFVLGTGSFLLDFHLLRKDHEHNSSATTLCKESGDLTETSRTNTCAEAFAYLHKAVKSRYLRKSWYLPIAIWSQKYGLRYWAPRLPETQPRPQAGRLSPRMLLSSNSRHRSVDVLLRSYRMTLGVHILQTPYHIAWEG
jgi:hypothetical protein